MPVLPVAADREVEDLDPVALGLERPGTPGRIQTAWDRTWGETDLQPRSHRDSHAD